MRLSSGGLRPPPALPRESVLTGCRPGSADANRSMALNVRKSTTVHSSAWANGFQSRQTRQHARRKARRASHSSSLYSKDPAGWAMVMIRPMVSSGRSWMVGMGEAGERCQLRWGLRDSHVSALPSINTCTSTAIVEEPARFRSRPSSSDLPRTLLAFRPPSTARLT
jgi:hypothetical protein